MFWRDEDYGPSSKHAGGVTRGRKRWRQLLHKIGRKQGQHEIEQQIIDDAIEGTFVCSRCGKVSVESDRSGDTTECIWC